MVDFNALAAPFPPQAISWRVGSTTQDKKKGMALAFIDARDVMERLDAVCGPAGWQCTYPHANGKTVCAIGIKAGDEWIWKSDGAGDTDVEAEKGALSDAFKRAAVRWGIGRYLYDLASPWVELEPAGRSFKIADRELAKLHALLGKPAAVANDNPITQAQREDAGRIIASIQQCRSLNDLDALKRQPEFTGAFKPLPEALKAQVNEAGKSHREKLLNDMPKTMAG
jgi:hypothetical protein